MKTFNIGDRVVITDYPDSGIDGMTGTVQSEPHRVTGYIKVMTDLPLPKVFWISPHKPDHLLLLDPEEMDHLTEQA